MEELLLWRWWPRERERSSPFKLAISDVSLEIMLRRSSAAEVATVLTDCLKAGSIVAVLQQTWKAPEHWEPLRLVNRRMSDCTK